VDLPSVGAVPRTCLPSPTLNEGFYTLGAVPYPHRGSPRRVVFYPVKGGRRSAPIPLRGRCRGPTLGAVPYPGGAPQRGVPHPVKGARGRQRLMTLLCFSCGSLGQVALDLMEGARDLRVQSLDEECLKDLEGALRQDVPDLLRGRCSTYGQVLP